MSSDIPGLDTPTAMSTEEKQWALFAHLSPLVLMWAGYLGFLGPLVIWLIKKDQMPFVNDQGKEALNFQLNMFAIGVVLAILVVPIVVVTLGIGLLILIPLALGLFAYSIVMPILAAIKVNAGEAYRYPYILRVIA